MMPQAIAVRDIGSRGALIETKFPLQPDSLHDLRLSLGIRTVVLKGRVAHCRGGDSEPRVYVSGVEFTEAPEHVERVINAFVQALKSVDSRSD
jgi:PilZ domain